MMEIASAGQLRASLLRWIVALVPVILLLGYLSGVAAGSGPDNPWFAALAKPGIYPPPIAFPIVWSLLYLLMGVALAIIMSARRARGQWPAVIAFFVQFALNLAWSPVFFAMHQITWALYLLVALDVALFITVVLFARVRPVAALLLVPYLAWVLFASVLNWQFLALNPGADGQSAAPTVVRMNI